MRKIYHALTLNLHQPPGNLQWLLDNNEWEAREILWALDGAGGNAAVRRNRMIVPGQFVPKPPRPRSRSTVSCCLASVIFALMSSRFSSPFTARSFSSSPMRLS
jgi:hypothetical protein